MNDTISSVINSLDDLATSVRNAYSDDRTMNEIWGWQFPALTRHDLANLASNLSNKLREYDIDYIHNDILEKISQIPVRIAVFKSRSLPYLFNGQGQLATPIYISLIEWITNQIDPIFSWEILQDNKALPNNLSRRLRSIQSELNEIVPKKEELQTQINLIQSATEAAESLPTDLESLKEARNKVNTFSTDSAQLYGKIDTYHKTVQEVSTIISNKKDEADKLVAQCEEAYKITTTKGLAAAFDQRAIKLSNSMWVWVLGLLFALGFGIYIGSHRFEALNSAMKSQTQAGYIWIQIFLSILSLGAPIWFAWIATKQISQRFKLSEDYAYKASVAKAYEGYRKEAARIDEELEGRLFSSALTRLEEAPLRLMESEHHGSPWHELISSDQFKEALDKVPSLKDKFIKVFSKKKNLEEANIDGQE